LKANASVKEVQNVIIWGNHSSTQYPDVNHGTIGGKPIRQVIADDKYLNAEFIETIQKVYHFSMNHDMETSNACTNVRVDVGRSSIRVLF